MMHDISRVLSFLERLLRRMKTQNRSGSLAPLLGGEGWGEGRDWVVAAPAPTPLTITLSLAYRGEGTRGPTHHEPERKQKRDHQVARRVSSLWIGGALLACSFMSVPHVRAADTTAAP